MAGIITIYDRRATPVAEINTAETGKGTLWITTPGAMAIYKEFPMLTEHPEPVEVCPTCRRVQ